MTSAVIVGGGHAGVEAALIIAKSNINVYLVSMDLEAIGRMSCNPAIGGLAKGHLVREIDALGGLMGKAADKNTLQHKTLNKSKGRAVWSPRAQIDKTSYSNYVKTIIKSNKNIVLVEDEVVSFKTKNGGIFSALLRSGRSIFCSSLIVTSGTFLNGKIHIGLRSFKAGRFGEKPSRGLTEALVNRGFEFGRLKTGTPPRLLSSSIDWSRCEKAFGDNKPTPFSISTKRPFTPKNIPCFITYTNESSHSLIRDNIATSAMFSGKINAVGPRYCPSIEDKIFRFSDRKRHQVFLEPEWLNSDQIYVNGFSTSLSQKTQLSSLRLLDGLEKCKIIRPGYAIEYDYFPSRQLKSTLESKSIKGLFLAGQINGTSGYEEAAAQGLIAGINASCSILDKPPLVLPRTESYIGVLIDDLITKHINEPYRMFTSSAEHRLYLRPDNVYSRLYKYGNDFNLYSFTRNKKIVGLIESEKKLLSKISNVSTKTIKQPKRTISSTIGSVHASKYSNDVLFNVETHIKYEGYVKIELERIKRLSKLENTLIPKDTDYKLIKNLSNESREKLILVKPETLGQASRIAGVRSSDIMTLAFNINR